MMSKIAQYLNEHILGEVTSSKAVRQRFSQDASILTITPELVMFPRVTNDIRKAARFSWQLAEKGHVLPITTRGGGSDQTGAAIGRGIIVNTTAHLNNVIHLGLKDKDRFVHVQPGVNFKSLNDILNWHGLHVPAYPESAAYSTVGGAVANNAGGVLSGRFGPIGDYVTRLEVVLANGDLIETTRLNKRDFSTKKGLQTFEGEIYRKLDGLIEDNQKLINDQLMGNERDNTGYGRLSQVRKRDGSFDLTPLFVGSQGTLGIISEIVLKTEYVSKEQTIVVAVVENSQIAHDAADSLRSLDPTILETFDGELFNTAKARGKKYPFFNIADSDVAVGAIIYLQFNDFGDRARAHKLKKALKILGKYDASVVTSADHAIEELSAIREVMSSTFASETQAESYPPLIDGAHIPLNRYDDFIAAVTELAKKHHVKLPLRTRVLDSVVFARAALQLDKLADKQKMLKLINDYSQLVDKHNGIFVAESSEGRVKANSAYALLEDDIKQLYAQVRLCFDPFGTLNPGVKQPSELKTLVEALRSTYDLADFAEHSPHS
ncbi:FAD-binding oxidoreductase [Candidatus Saccharibacteria bacterium]|nr:FAD-binding oxidoreductase [Candidatus Saccharibacteria bacterium]